MQHRYYIILLTYYSTFGLEKNITILIDVWHGMALKTQLSTSGENNWVWVRAQGGYFEHSLW